MTIRTLTHPTPGAVVFDARSFAACIEVAVTDTAHATVTITTADSDGPSHDAVAGARIEHRDQMRGTIGPTRRAATAGSSAGDVRSHSPLPAQGFTSEAQPQSFAATAFVSV